MEKKNSIGIPRKISKIGRTGNFVSCLLVAITSRFHIVAECRTSIGLTFLAPKLGVRSAHMLHSESHLWDYTVYVVIDEYRTCRSIQHV